MWKVFCSRGRIGFDIYYRFNRKDADALAYMLKSMYPKSKVSVEEVEKKL